MHVVEQACVPCTLIVHNARSVYLWLCTTRDPWLYILKQVIMHIMKGLMAKVSKSVKATSSGCCCPQANNWMFSNSGQNFVKARFTWSSWHVVWFIFDLIQYSLAYWSSRRIQRVKCCSNKWFHHRAASVFRPRIHREPHIYPHTLVPYRRGAIVPERIVSCQGSAGTKG